SCFLSFFFSYTSAANRDLPSFPTRRSSDLFNLTIPLQQLNGLETLVIIMVANKYAFLQITRRRFLNEWEAFKKVISRNRLLVIRSEERFSRNAETDLVCRLLLEKNNNYAEH